MTLISIENVSVCFPIYEATQRSLRNRLISATTGGRIGSDARNRVVVEALFNINLKLQNGDKLALIGHNGAGKSSLLRVMAGIDEPTSGRVRVRGKTAPLLDSSLGIDQDMTGYENIELRGLLFRPKTSRNKLANRQHCRVFGAWFVFEHAHADVFHWHASATDFRGFHQHRAGNTLAR